MKWTEGDGWWRSRPGQNTSKFVGSARGLESIHLTLGIPSPIIPKLLSVVPMALV